MPRKKKVTNAGGKREGAGRKKIYGEDTVLAQYSVPVSKFEIFDSAATEMLEQWKIKDGDGIKAKVDRAIQSKEITKISHIDRESAIKVIEDTLNDMPLIQDRGVFTDELPVFNDDKVFPPSDEEIKQNARDKNAETKESQPEIIVYDSENEKGVEAVFSDDKPEKDHSEPRYSETQIESLIDTANAKYKTGKIIKEVGTNEEYRLGYNLDFDRELNAVVMSGTSIEKGIYKSRVVLFSNDEWAKF